MNLKYIMIILLCIGCRDEQDGRVKIGYYTDGVVKTLGYPIDTLFNGQFFWYYPNGKVEQIITYRKGIPNGHAYRFYESGALKSVWIYERGKQVGYSEEYYDHSIGVLKNIRVLNDAGKLIYIREIDSTGKITREEGKY